MSDDYPIEPYAAELLRALMHSAAGRELQKVILPNGESQCPYCKCKLVYDPRLGRMRHKVPKKGEACLFLRKITQGGRT